MKAFEAKHYLLEVLLLREKVPSFDQFPFNLPAVRNLDRLVLHPAVTFLVGENGTGKSTLMEAIAVACGFNPEGGTRNFNFATHASHSVLEPFPTLLTHLTGISRLLARRGPRRGLYDRKWAVTTSSGRETPAFGGPNPSIGVAPPLARCPTSRRAPQLSRVNGFGPSNGSIRSERALDEYLRIVRGPRRRRDGFFLRAESFYNVATEIENLGDGLIDSYGGRSLHAQSHGESFLALFMNRFGGKGLYLLDEPEAALSPTRQMALISRLHELVEDDSQFVIATHSPIIMAYPHARIFLLTESGIEEISYEETEHYRVTRDFLSNREKLLKILMED